MPERRMNNGGRPVFLLDVDNTLLDNDRIEQDLRDHLTRYFGVDACERYWSILEELRRELGYSDFLGALQRYRLERLHDPRLLLMSSFLVDYPFADLSLATKRVGEPVETVTNNAVDPIDTCCDEYVRKLIRDGLCQGSVLSIARLPST